MPWSSDQPPIVTIRISAALVTSSRITTARVALDSALSRLGWTRTVSAIAVTIPWYAAFLAPVRGRGGTGRRASFRCSWPRGRGGSSPSARTDMGYANDASEVRASSWRRWPRSATGASRSTTACSSGCSGSAPLLAAAAGARSWRRRRRVRRSTRLVGALRHWLLELGGVRLAVGVSALRRGSDSADCDAAAVLARRSSPVLAGLHLALTFALGQRPEREAAAVPPS